MIILSIASYLISFAIAFIIGYAIGRFKKKK